MLGRDPRMWDTKIWYCEYLIKLTRFDAGNNQINNITGISFFSELKILSLNDNNIVDIRKIEKLYNLDYINLSDNQVTNISSMSNLPNLRILLLQNNQIMDIDPLIQNPGINSGDVIVLTENPLNDISINTYIPTLMGRGVTVTFWLYFIRRHVNRQRNSYHRK